MSGPFCKDANCPFYDEFPHDHFVLPAIKRTNPVYVGDAVYASWDAENEQVWLSLNDHEAVPVIALNTDVLNAIFKYAKRMMEDA